MGEQQDQARELAASTKALRQLESELKASQQQIAALLELCEKLQFQLTRQEATVARLDLTLTQLLTGRIWRTLRAGGDLIKKITTVRARLAARSQSSEQSDKDYERWIREFESPAEAIIQAKLPVLQRKPLISVVMPVYNTDLSQLTAAIQSVAAQSYDNWELCIADDCSTRPEIGEALRSFADQDARIKLVSNPKRAGISAATNAALNLVSGEYVCFLDHDDTLSPHALAYVCEALNRRPAAELIYSDEDKIDSGGRRFDPYFKPDWSPDLLLSSNYICHLLVLRRSLLDRIGSLRSEVDGSQDYDLILRAIEQTTKIEHIPRVLYHWRAAEGSTAESLRNKGYVLETAQKALQEHFRRTGLAAIIEPGATAGWWRARYAVPEQTRVSIIIASGGNAKVLRTNLESIFGKTTYNDYEVVVIDNSKHAKIEEFVNRFNKASHRVRYIDWRNKPFNYSEINNAAARQCRSPLLLFLNDDTSVIAPDWLRSMVELAARPEVGAVGAKLLYPNGRIQHAGVVMGLYENCGHAFSGLPGGKIHYFGLSDSIRNVSAVTGACLMTRTEVFQEAGGFDAENFAIAFNDVDLCLKIAGRGYRVLFTPYALLYHHEAFSKSSKDFVPHPDEVARMQWKWRGVIECDPYYNVNLSRTRGDYSLRTRSSNSLLAENEWRERYADVAADGPGEREHSRELGH